MKNKLKLILLCFSLGVGCIYMKPTSKTYAASYEGNEDYYYEFCSSSDLDKEGVEICRGFKEYLANKQDALDQQIANNQLKIDSLNLELVEIYDLISITNGQIDDQRQKIEVLNAEIERLEKDIDKKDKQIRERMYMLQDTVNSNMYLNYLLGSSSIDDFYSRMTSIDEITEYDHDLMISLKEDKDQVEKSKEQEEKEKSRLEELKEQQNALANKLQSLIQDCVDENEAAAALSEQYANEIGQVGQAIEEALQNNNNFLDIPVSSYGFSQPVDWGIVTSAGMSYPEGGMHIALDIGGIYGSNLYSCVDGYVIYVGTGCQSDGGFLGNYCNGGMGNYTIFVTRMNGTTYGMRYLHMLNENYLGWSYGDFIPVYKGDVVGHMGHSGNSTGTHLHLDIFNLGDISYEEAVRRFAAYGSFFGVYRSYDNVCGYTSSPPCVEVPSDLFGYYYMQEIGSR